MWLQLQFWSQWSASKLVHFEEKPPPTSRVDKNMAHGPQLHLLGRSFCSSYHIQVFHLTHDFTQSSVKFHSDRAWGDPQAHQHRPGLGLVVSHSSSCKGAQRGLPSVTDRVPQIHRVTSLCEFLNWTRPPRRRVKLHVVSDITKNQRHPTDKSMEWPKLATSATFNSLTASIGNFSELVFASCRCLPQINN